MPQKIFKRCQKLRFCCDFIFFGASLCGNPAVECQKLFGEFFFARCIPLREKQGSGVKNWEFFLQFWCAQNVLRIVLTICFATYGRFFKRTKMSESRQKTSKTEGFWQFFHVRSNPLRAFECQKLRVAKPILVRPAARLPWQQQK